MQNQNKLIGYLEEDKPILLKYGKYGYYLLCSNKTYSIPKCFGPGEEIDLKKSEKIITWKDAHMEQKQKEKREDSTIYNCVESKN